jgi:hypothetical protein
LVSFAYRREFSHILGEILRPVASVQVRAVRGHWFPALMYIDSGADITLVPSDFGKLLGMDLSRNRTSLAGVTGAPLQASLQLAEMRIGTTIEKAKVAVAMRNDVPYLLGREGLFKSFKITFEEYKGLTSFTSRSKVKKSYFGAARGIGPFMAEDEMQGHEIRGRRVRLDRISRRDNSRDQGPGPARGSSKRLHNIDCIASRGLEQVHPERKRSRSSIEGDRGQHQPRTR